MKIAFVTEMGFEGKIQSNHSNMRTEFAWMRALDADHRHLYHYREIRDYDHVFVIFPKGMVYLNAIGLRLSNDRNPVSDILQSNFIEVLKQNNRKVYFVQEGPHWLWNDYEVADQIGYINMITECDAIFCHNHHDLGYYSGMFPKKKVHIIPSLMMDELVSDITPSKDDKAIIGGNFSRWYGGFESYLVASEYGVPIFVQDSHAKRNQEAMMENLTHLPRLVWIDWMRELSKFKYAVHLMPTVAAGTFSLNCAYFGIPCIGNQEVDTQFMCHPRLSVDVTDIFSAKRLARKLRDDKDFYSQCSEDAKKYYNQFYSLEIWKNKIEKNIG